MMKSVLLVAMIILFLPVVTAHEHRVIMIGNEHFEFTVGSLGEPIYVDDKSGVQLMVKHVGSMVAPLRNQEQVDHSQHEVTSKDAPVLGLEKTLQVEILADGKKKVLPFAAAWGKPGEYHAVFYPTEATELTYRIFGTMNATPIDISFECSAQGHAMTSAEETTQVQLADNIWQMSTSGSFGCPRDKAEVAFPKEVSSMAQMNEGAIQGWRPAARLNNILATLALVVSVLSLIVAVRKRKR